MARYGERREAKPQERRQHEGFSSDGRLIRSEMPIDNALTRYVRDLIARIRATPITPADVVWDISRQPDYVQRAFDPEVLGKWSTLDRLEQWKHVAPGGCLMMTIASWGYGQDPPWRADEWKWTALCDEWEKRVGAESRFAVALRNLDALEAWMGGEHADVARRALTEAIRRGGRGE